MSSEIRERFRRFSTASSEGAAVHALLAWLDTLPAEVLDVAEGRRIAGVSRVISDAIPSRRPKTAEAAIIHSKIVESDARLARNYWEFPWMIYHANGGHFDD